MKSAISSYAVKKNAPRFIRNPRCDVETASSRFETKRQDAASTKPGTGSPKPEIRNPKSGDKEIDDG